MPVYTNIQQSEKHLLEILKRSSRSFYLTLKFLPQSVRSTIGIAYQLARIADTLSDNAQWTRDLRNQYLLAFKNSISDPSKQFYIDEKDLNILEPLDKSILQTSPFARDFLDVFDEYNKSAVKAVVLTLISGMEKDMSYFANNSNNISSLNTIDDLDEYTYLVAGCVGEFWTKVCEYNIPMEWPDSEKQIVLGVNYGKALQLTNILRDISKDAKMGRCYLPNEQMTMYNCQAVDVFKQHFDVNMVKLLDYWISRTEVLFEDALGYVMNIPKRQLRLRFACMLPVFIGLDTVSLLKKQYLIRAEFSSVKIKRIQVYKTMLLSILFLFSNSLMSLWFRTKYKS